MEKIEYEEYWWALSDWENEMDNRVREFIQTIEWNEMVDNEGLRQTGTSREDNKGV